MNQPIRQKIRRTYSRPPIAERFAKISAALSEEIFVQNFESWREKVERDYHDYEPDKEWLVMVKEKNGVPLFDTLQPELRITHKFAKKSKDGRREFGMRCLPNSLDLHLFTRPDIPHGYNALSGEIRRWTPLWMSHFSVESIKTVQLHYSNLLNPETVGPFITNDGGLDLQKVLQFFLTVPGSHEMIIAPYDCTATVLLSKDPQIGFTFRIYGDLKTPPQPVVWVDFTVNVIPKAGLDFDLAMRMFDLAHDAILDRFDLVFTDDAKRFFSGQ